MINLLVIYARFSLLITVALYVLGSAIIERSNIGLMMYLTATLLVSTILVDRLGMIGIGLSICGGLYMICLSIIAMNGMNIEFKRPRISKLFITIYLIAVLLLGIIGGIIKNPNSNINFNEDDTERIERSIRRSIIRNIR